MNNVFRTYRVVNPYVAATEISHQLQKRYRKLQITASEIEEAIEDAELTVVRNDEKPIPFWLRFTVVLAIPLFITLVVMLPVHFLITGLWGYSKYSWIKDWFSAIGW